MSFPRPRRKVPIKGIIIFHILLGLAIGAAYEYRFGYELITPSPPPEPPIKPEARGGTPQVCVSYDPSTRSFGSVSALCPDGYAYFANHDVGGSNKSGPGSYVELRGTCCKLPHDDILTDRHIYSEFERCPDQYVATGGVGPCSSGCSMRCTQINTDKYKLGQEHQAYFWKRADVGRTFGQGLAKRIYWEQIPVALRWGAGRTLHHEWSNDGCVGVPFGSLLVRKKSKRCDGFYYRELLYLDGTPVKMLPDCDAVSDPYNPHPECLSKSDSPSGTEAATPSGSD